MQIRTASLALLLLAACGSDDESSALEGMYELESWTSNAEGCDAEGGPAFEESMYSHFFLRTDEFFGESFLNAVLCADLPECEEKAADTETLFLGPFIFSEGNDDDGWTSQTAILFTDTCDGTVQHVRLTGEPGASVRIEEETRAVMGVAMNDEGECDEEDAYEQAEGQPCQELDVVKGTFLADL